MRKPIETEEKVATFSKAEIYWFSANLKDVFFFYSRMKE